MLEKSRNAVFFQWFVCQVSRKVGLLKRRVRSHVLREESKNCTPLWRKAHSEVKNVQNMTCSEHFCKFRCQKNARHCGEKHIRKWKCTKHDVFGPLWYVLMLKNCTRLWRKAHLQVKIVQNMRCLDHFGTFWCWKIAWRCGETHICKSKCAKHDGFGALLSVQMLINCTPLWRKAHLEVKMFKNCSLRSTFGRSDVENQSVSKFVSQSISQVVN